MEVSVASKPIPPVVAMQVAKPTKELIPLKPAEGVPMLDKPAQPQMTLPGGLNQHKSSPTAVDSGSQSHSMLGNPASDPSPNPTPGTEVAKKDLASAAKGGDVPQASAATSLDLNVDNENMTSGVGISEHRHETALADEIKELWCSQKRKSTSLRRSRVELETLRNSLPARTGRGGMWDRVPAPGEDFGRRLIVTWKNGSFQRPRRPRNAPLVRFSDRLRRRSQTW